MINTIAEIKFENELHHLEQEINNLRDMIFDLNTRLKKVEGQSYPSETSQLLDKFMAASPGYLLTSEEIKMALKKDGIDDIKIALEKDDINWQE